MRGDETCMRRSHHQSYKLAVSQDGRLLEWFSHVEPPRPCTFMEERYDVLIILLANKLIC